ncbi:hypothetical protein Gromo_00216 [Candidatus Gromoviella agglomerans]|nr:hypothetical protein Gromo_00216 [Candidatus Gromoviella agglomerans]
MILSDRRRIPVFCYYLGRMFKFVTDFVNKCKHEFWILYDIGGNRVNKNNKSKKSGQENNDSKK